MGWCTVGAKLSLLEWEVKDKQGEDAMMGHISFSWYQSKIQTLNESCSPRDSQESSSTPQFKDINSLALSFLYSPTLTSIYEYWKNHSFD